MIITPCVPTLGEPSADVGTKQATPTEVHVQNEPSSQQTQPENPDYKTVFDQSSHVADKFLYLRWAAEAIEKNFANLALERTSLFNLAKSRLQSIHLLESLLDREKTVNRQLENDLKRAKAELHLLIEQRETNEIFCAEAV